jgi:hypothetical protein
MAEKPSLDKLMKEIGEARSDARANLDLARADLEQAGDPELAALINEEIDALLEEITLLEEELVLASDSYQRKQGQ